MTSNVRVLVVEQQDATGDDPATHLQNHGYAILSANTDSQAMDIAVRERPDAVVIHTPESTQIGARALIQALREAKETQDIPVLINSDKPSGDANLESEGDQAPDAVYRTSLHGADLTSRIDSLVRLNTMRDELARRTATVRDYGISEAAHPSHPEQIGSINLMIVGGKAEEAGEIGAALADSATVAYCKNNFDAMDQLTSGGFDAIVVLAEGEDPELLQFCADARHNVRLYSTPIVMITNAGAPTDLAAVFEQGVSEVLERPWSGEEIKERLRLLVRQLRYRRKMQEMYGKALHLATSDSLTGLYNHGFLHAHLARQISDAESRKRPLTLCMFALTEMRDINQTFGYAAGDQILRQVGSLVGGLVRGEDLTARYSGTKFCVVMPDTPPHEAEFVLRRIGGVVANTSFATSQMEDPVFVHLKSGQVTLEQGKETAEDLIARARKNLT